MAKIPRILPTGKQITTQSPGRKIRKASVTGEIVSHLGGALEEIGSVIRQSNLVVEKTKAENEFDRRMLDIQTRVQDDMDFSEENISKYDAEINKAIGDSSQFISIPEERSNYELRQKAKADITRFKVRNVFGKRSRDVGKAELEISLQNKENDFINAEHSAEKTTAKIERDNKIQEAVEAGYIEPADAILTIDKLDREWAIAEVEHDIQVNPRLTKELLEMEDSPYDIPEDERVKLVKSANAAIKLEKMTKIDELSDKLFDDQLKLSDVDAAIDIIGGKQANIFKRRLQTDQAKELKELAEDNRAAAQYVDLVNSLIEDDLDAFDFNEELLSAFDDGVLSTEESKKLKTIKKKLLDIRKVRRADSNQIFAADSFTTSLNLLKAWFARNNPSDDELIQNIRDLIEYDKDFDKTEAELSDFNEQLIRKQQRKINPNAGRFKKDQVLVNEFGIKAKVADFDEDGEPLMEY